MNEIFRRRNGSQGEAAAFREGGMRFMHFSHFLCIFLSFFECVFCRLAHFLCGSPFFFFAFLGPPLLFFLHCIKFLVFFFWVWKLPRYSIQLFNYYYYSIIPHNLFEFGAIVVNFSAFFFAFCGFCVFFFSQILRIFPHFSNFFSRPEWFIFPVLQLFVHHRRLFSSFSQISPIFWQNWPIWYIFCVFSWFLLGIISIKNNVHSDLISPRPKFLLDFLHFGFAVSQNLKKKVMFLELCLKKMWMMIITSTHVATMKKDGGAGSFPSPLQRNRLTDWGYARRQPGFSFFAFAPPPSSPLPPLFGNQTFFLYLLLPVSPCIAASPLCLRTLKPCWALFPWMVCILNYMASFLYKKILAFSCWEFVWNGRGNSVSVQILCCHGCSCFGTRHGKGKAEKRYRDDVWEGEENREERPWAWIIWREVMWSVTIPKVSTQWGLCVTEAWANRGVGHSVLGFCPFLWLSPLGQTTKPVWLFVGFGFAAVVVSHASLRPLTSPSPTTPSHALRRDGPPSPWAATTFPVALHPIAV